MIDENPEQRKKEVGPQLEPEHESEELQPPMRKDRRSQSPTHVHQKHMKFEIAQTQPEIIGGRMIS